MQTAHTTQHIASPNHDLEILRTHFPHCFDKSGDFDVKKFKKNLSDTGVDFSRESYVWIGCERVIQD